MKLSITQSDRDYYCCLFRINKVLYKIIQGETMKDGIRKANHDFIPPSEIIDTGIDLQRMPKPVARMLANGSRTGG